ncbi:unnamed protein product [Arabis nemorensis]|uniref:Uncharacterized protein n=1 Tax=Arabis nemorensis TaxID=586526 RepID=A0A565CNE8_9BRAS|nr:unnamed protein product [Arabis nemorensis]
MWRFPTVPDKYCIYRGPQRLRRVNPEAYTPQLVLIGPLHHSLKSQALESLGDITKTTIMGYLNMEEYKKIYLAKFAERVDGENTIDGFRRIIEEDRERIRIYDVYYKESRPKETGKTGDLIVDDPCLHATVKEDLMLLENQLPYFILEKLFGPIVPRLDPDQTFRNLILDYFGSRGKISDDSRFIHFTDMFRCVGLNSSSGPEEPSKTIFIRLADIFRYVNMKTCGSTKQPTINSKDLFLKKKDESKAVNYVRSYMRIKHMYNAAKLHNAGVKFVVMKNQFAMDLRFDNGRLKLPSLWFDEYMESILRNIMALEQCHYPSNARLCNFITFLDFLIDSDEDVDLLFVKGSLYAFVCVYTTVLKRSLSVT